MKQAIIYLRVSTELQATEGISLEAQKAKAEAWCVLNDYTVKGVYVDAGISGKTIYQRQGLQDALNVCESGNVLIVYSLSRLSRSTKDTIDIADRLNQIDTDLVSLSERIDTTTAAGKMVFRMLAVLSEFERDQTVERVKLALQYKKTKHELVGSVPYGYRLDVDGIHLIVDETEQVVIALAKQLYKAGLSLRQIATTLASKGYTSRNGKAFIATQIKRLVA